MSECSKFFSTKKLSTNIDSSFCKSCLQVNPQDSNIFKKSKGNTILYQMTLSICSVLADFLTNYLLLRSLIAKGCAKRYFLAHFFVQACAYSLAGTYNIPCSALFKGLQSNTQTLTEEWLLISWLVKSEMLRVEKTVKYAGQGLFRAKFGNLCHRLMRLIWTWQYSSACTLAL